MTTENNGGADNPQGGNNNEQNQTPAPNLGAIRKAGQQEVLGVLSQITGQEFTSTKAAGEFIENLIKTADSVKSNKQKDNSSSTSGEIAELRQMIQSLQSDLVKKDTVVRQTNLQSQIKDVAIRNGFDPQYLDYATNEFEKQIEFDENGKFFVKTKEGTPRLNESGDKFDLDSLAKEILKSRPKLAVEDVRVGTGTKFGFNGSNANVIPNAGEDMAGWKAWKKANQVGSSGLQGARVTVTSQN